VERRTVLTTSRTTVTTWLDQDLDDLHRLHSDPDTMRWIRPGRPETYDETRDRLAAYVVAQEAGAAKWRVADRATDVFLGRAGFGGDDRHRELGYTLLPETWGRGLATELATALVSWHVAHPLAEPPGELTAYAALANPASRRVLEKSGLTFVDEREHHQFPSAYYRR
jgi:RimJ/RimL family protein N-acetyltransferase